MIDSAVQTFAGRGDVVAWLGPTIGPSAFEIGVEVKTAIEQALDPNPECFQRGQRGKWLANLYLLAANDLQRRKIWCGYDASICTVSDPVRYFSYRRSQPCGRMASIIWMEQ